MTITSLAYIAFVAAAAIAYYLLTPRRFQWATLLVASLAFYLLAGGVGLLGYVAFTTTTVYACARLLVRAKGKPGRKALIAATLAGNFGVLAFFKWWGTAAAAANAVLGALGAAPLLAPHGLILPLGISFYTFQAAGYLIDVYRGSAEPERNYARLALFVSFFPQLVQGPISRHSQLAGQLYMARAFDYGRFRMGCQLALWGAFKKLVVADRLILAVDAVFGGSYGHTGAYVVIGLAASSLQIYADFSGGVDIARGVAQIFGVTMPENFRRPFFAVSLPEYWRRWHITLQNWWRDYVYYPLALSRPISRLASSLRRKGYPALGKAASVYLCVNVVRVVNAMWHGASPKYLAYGFYHGILIVLGMVAAPYLKRLASALRVNVGCHSWKAFQMVRTFALVVIGRSFLCADGFLAGLGAMGRAAAFAGAPIPIGDGAAAYGLSAMDVRILAASLALMLAVGVAQERGVKVREWLGRQNMAFQWAVTLAAMLATLIWGRYGYGHSGADFVYMGF